MPSSIPMKLDFTSNTQSNEHEAKPSAYKGLYAFHKYWGKKPREAIAHAISLLTKPGQIVIDPFVGSGTSGREAILQSRRFIGMDINPVAVELTQLLTCPPDPIDLHIRKENY